MQLTSYKQRINYCGELRSGTRSRQKKTSYYDRLDGILNEVGIHNSIPLFRNMPNCSSLTEKYASTLLIGIRSAVIKSEPIKFVYHTADFLSVNKVKRANEVYTFALWFYMNLSDNSLFIYFYCPHSLFETSHHTKLPAPEVPCHSRQVHNRY